MIALHDVSRRVGDRGQQQQILAPTSVVFEDRERVGILAARGTGKSIIARMLCGIEAPDSGDIQRSGRVSWPIGFAGTLHPELRVIENLDLIARILGEDPERLIAFCNLAAGLGPLLHAPMKTCSPARRAAIAFYCSVGVACDTYIADDTVGCGQDQEREVSEMLLETRLADAGLVMLSSNPQSLARFCTRIFVLLQGHLLPVSDLKAAQEALQTLQYQKHGDQIGDENE